MSAVGVVAMAVLLGTGLAGGILLVAQSLPRWAAPPLSTRIAPYLRDIADPLGLTPLRVTATRFDVGRLRERLVSVRGDRAVLTRRLRHAGSALDPVAFRGRQLAWGVAGLVCGALLAVAGVVTGRGGPVVALLPLVLAAGAVLAYEQRITIRARRRIARVQDELPTVLEFLALCLAAGEGLRAALTRVGDVGSGVLPEELRRAVLASATGSTLTEALGQVADDAGVPALSRAVDHLVTAMERGAPLSQVLQDQARDAREDAKRLLLEAAGRKEILMLLPLVFLILPLSVLFAVFPGVVMLKLGMG